MHEQTASPKGRGSLLYALVLTGALLGVAMGVVTPSFAVTLKPLGALFVALVKVVITPIVFTTIVLGVGAAREMSKLGRVGGLALVYFLVMTTIALGIGLLVGNAVHPGRGIQVTVPSPSVSHAGANAATGHGWDRLLNELIPQTLFSSLTSGAVLQALFIALLVGFALQGMGDDGTRILSGVALVQKLVFRVLALLLWAAPVGALGAMAGVVGETGLGALKSLGTVMLAFYATCLLFVFLVLGPLLWLVTRLSLFSLLRHLAGEFLLILSTSSSETALPRLMEKLEHLGVAKPVVGIVVPCGYSFNLDGTAIYLTMASLFIAESLGKPMALGEQLALLAFMVVASKGAAAVTGAGIATLSAGLESHRPDLVGGVAIVIGIDRFMSEARALTNFAGNAVATLVIGAWTGQLDKSRARQVLQREPLD